MTNSPINNYIFEFNGWAQVRMATDPDPSNDPRGVSGYSFALPGEPDNDQIIYFQNKKGVIRRSFCPKVGVNVTRGWEYQTLGTGGDTRFAGKKKAIRRGHPLYNAEVDLLGSPIFDSRNGTVVYNGFGIINPFIFDVKGKGISIQRRFFADPDNPQENLEHYSLDTLSPFEIATAIPNTVDMILSADVLQRSAFRNERLKNLEKELAGKLKLKRKSLKTLNEIAALQKRIAELKINDPNNRRTNQIGTKALINYPLNSKKALHNGKEISPSAPWLMQLWLGGWDTDAMCFWVEGYVQIVLD